MYEHNPTESYDSLQAQFKEKRFEFNRASASSQEAQANVTALEREMLRLESQLSEVLNSEKTNKLQAEISKARRPHEEKVAILEKELLVFPARAQGILDNLEVTDVVNNKESSLRKQARDITEQVGSLIKQGVGSSFYDRYMQHLNDQQVSTKLTHQQVIERFKSSLPRLKKSLGKKRNWLTKAFETGDQMFEALESNRSALALGGLISVVGVLTSPVSLPLYFLVITLNSVREVKKSYTFRQTLLEVKAVTDNLDSLDLKSHNIYDTKYKDLKTKMEEKLATEHAQLKQRRVQLQFQLDSVEHSIRTTYKFDDTEIMTAFQERQEAAMERLTTAKDDFMLYQKRMETLAKEIKELESKINNSISSLVSHYLDYDRVGVGHILKANFLLDITDNKPVFFELQTGKPSFFFYQEEQDMLSFLKLVLVQLRGIMSTHSLRIQLWDDSRMGVDFQAFSGNDSHLFKLLRESKDFTESLETAHDIIVKRNSIVRREHAHINDYNEYMLSIDSLTEFYQMYLIISASSSVFENQILSNLLRVGPAVGLLPWIFIKNSQLADHDESLLNVDAHFYRILNGKVTTIAKQRALETMKSFGV